MKKIINSLRNCLIRIIIHPIWRLCDKIEGIDMARWEELDEIGINPDIGNRYMPTRLKRIKQIMKSFDIKPTDSIIDIGCGKGQALRGFSRYPFKRIAGVELSERLYLIAKNNMRVLGLNKRVEIFNTNAIDFDQYGNFNYFYIFNTFPSEIMKKVITVIESYVDAEEKTIIYFNPICHDDIIANGIFKEIQIPNKLNMKIYKNN